LHGVREGPFFFDVGSLSLHNLHLLRSWVLSISYGLEFLHLLFRGLLCSLDGVIVELRHLFGGLLCLVHGLHELHELCGR
jgi:hypothetical protein